MKYDNEEVLRIVFQSYSLQILKMIKQGPKRFGELRIEVKTRQTLSTRLANLIEYGLIEVVPIKVKGRFANYYRITKNGEHLLMGISKI